MANTTAVLMIRLKVLPIFIGNIEIVNWNKNIEK